MVGEEVGVDEQVIIGKGELIVFMGGMNAMPMMYAVELKKLGFDVLYFVDAAPQDMLSRPENHYPEIFYPYPRWIIERRLFSQLLLPLFPRFSAFYYRWYIRRLTGRKKCVFVLNGFFSSLSPFLSSASRKIALSHGSDLDVWGNTNGVDELITGFGKRSFFRFLPASLAGRLIKMIVGRQYEGYRQSNAVLYFPKGFNHAGDTVVQSLVDAGVQYVSRHDISDEPLKRCTRTFKEPGTVLEIFSGVRFLFETFPNGNRGYNKGNDVIIEGLALYYSRNKNIRIHFVSKGEDVGAAKALCEKLGIDAAVVWHDEMKLSELLALYEDSDICFDQVGAHWIGAVGGYALWLGKPLIANDASLVDSGVWPHENPICSASTPQAVYDWLVKLEDIGMRREVAEKSKRFVEAHMMPGSVLKKLFDVGAS